MTILMPEILEQKKLRINDLIQILEKELIRQIKVENLKLAKRLEIQIKDIDEKYFIEKLEQAIQTTI